MDLPIQGCKYFYLLLTQLQIFWILSCKCVVQCVKQLCVCNSNILFSYPISYHRECSLSVSLKRCLTRAKRHLSIHMAVVSVGRGGLLSSALSYFLWSLIKQVVCMLTLGDCFSLCSGVLWAATVLVKDIITSGWFYSMASVLTKPWLIHSFPECSYISYRSTQCAPVTEM